MQQHIKQKDRIDSIDLVDNGLVSEISIDHAKLGIFLCPVHNRRGYIRIDQYGEVHRILVERMKRIPTFRVAKRRQGPRTTGRQKTRRPDL